MGKVRPVPVASYALCFRRLVQVDARDITNVNAIAAAGTLPDYSVLTASFRGP